MSDFIKGSSARGKKIIAMYNQNQGYYLWDVYGSASSAKEKAWDWCHEQCHVDNGTNFHICSHSSHQFTVAWAYTDAETGHRIIRVETASHTYKVDTEI